MAAVTLLGSSFTTANGSKSVNATPAVGDLIILVCAHTGNTAATAPSDDQGGTYTQLTTAQKATNVDRMGIWARDSLISSAVSTVFTHNPGTTTGGGLVALKVTGIASSHVGTSAAVQWSVQNNQAAATPAPIFPANPSSANPIIGAVFNATNPAGMTPRTNFTERFDGGYSNPTSGLEIMSRDSGETALTQTWGSASASAFCSLIVELDASVPPAPPSSGNFFQVLM